MNFSKGTAANVAAVHQSAHKLRDTFLFPEADRITAGTQRRNEEINQTERARKKNLQLIEKKKKKSETVSNRAGLMTTRERKLDYEA